MTDIEQVERLTERLIAAVPKLDPRRAEDRAGTDPEAGCGSAGVRSRGCGRGGYDRVECSRPPGALAGCVPRRRRRSRRVHGLERVEIGEHRIEVDWRRLTAWCAWDTLFLPGLLGRPARVSSRCPVTSEAISLTVTADGPHSVSPAGTVLSFLAPEGPFDADVVRSFCHFLRFFASEQAAHGWIAERPGMFTVSVDDSFRLGQQTNAAAFGAALDGAGMAA
jgi:Alkylmercury lyase